MTEARPSNAPRRSASRRLNGALAWTLALVLAAVVAVSAAPARAQDFRLPGLNGGQLSAGDLAQGTTILVVWASWSPKCRDIVDRVNAIHRAWGGRARVATVDFQEDRADVAGFLKGKSLSVPVYLDTDGSFSKSKAVTTLPGLLVIRDGKTAYRGRLPDDPDSVLSGAIQ
jgi:thiol-disulfide isomerase/thioredoxin